MAAEAKTQVRVRLVGEDGNVFAIIATVRNALRQAGLDAIASDFTADALACRSYDEVLNLVMRTVEVE